MPMYTVAGPIVLPPIRYGPSLQMRALRPRQLYGLYRPRGRDDQAEGRPLWTQGSTVCRRLSSEGTSSARYKGSTVGRRAPRPPWSERGRGLKAPATVEPVADPFRVPAPVMEAETAPLHLVSPCYHQGSTRRKGTRIDPTREPHRPAHHGSPQRALPGVWPRQLLDDDGMSSRSGRRVVCSAAAGFPIRSRSATARTSARALRLRPAPLRLLPIVIDLHPSEPRPQDQVVDGLHAAGDEEGQASVTCCATPASAGPMGRTMYLAEFV